MKHRVRAAAVVLACGAASLGPAAAGGLEGTEQSVTGSQGARVCLPNDLGATRAYAEGRARAVLVLRRYEAGSGLLVKADDGTVTQIGVFPRAAFDAADGAEPRRFLLPGGRDVRCWTVEFEASSDGAATIAVELIPLTGSH